MKKGLVICLSVFAISVCGVFVSMTKEPSDVSIATQEVMYASPGEMPEIAYTSVTTTTATQPTIEVVETSATESVAEAEEVIYVSSVAEPEVVATTMTEATVTEAVTTETETTETTAAAKSNAQLMADEIMDELLLSLQKESTIPASWNAWERRLVFSNIYDDYTLTCTAEQAKYDWNLANNPNNFKIAMVTALTENVGSLPDEFAFPNDIEDYSQFCTSTPSGLDQNNLGCYILMENNETDVRIFFNGSHMSVVAKCDGETGYAYEQTCMPCGWIVQMHTVYVESEVFDEYIGSAIYCYRTAGAFDYRLIDVLEALASCKSVTN